MLAIEFKNSDDIITKDHIINSLLTTSNLNDYINPFDKDKNYRIDSKDGDDTIITHNGNDTILAGNGNDTIDSGDGNDTYIFERGFGNDTIINYNPDLYTDTVEFKGINKDELTFKQIDSNLVISFKDSNIKDSLNYKRFLQAWL